MNLVYAKFLSTSLSPSKQGAFFYLSFFGAMGIFAPYLNIYLNQELGLSGRHIGLLSLAFPIMTIGVAMPLAMLADRRNWRVFILMGAIIGCSLTIFSANFPRTFAAWAILMGGFTACFCPIIPLANSVITGMSVRYHLNYGGIRLWGSVGFACTAVGCGVLWEKFGFRPMFTTAAVVFPFALFFASHLEEFPASVEKQPMKHSSPDIIRDIGLMILLCTTSLVGIAMQFSFIFDGLYMKYLGGTQFLVGLLFGLTAFSELPSMHYSAVLARLLTRPKTLLLAYGVLCAAFFGYFLVYQPWMFLLMAIVRGLGFGLFLVSTIRFSSERVPDNKASTIQSMITVCIFGVAPLIAAPLGGELYDCFGPKAIFLCGSIIVGGAILFLSVAIYKGVLTDVKEKSGAT